MYIRFNDERIKKQTFMWLVNEGYIPVISFPVKIVEKVERAIRVVSKELGVNISDFAIGYMTPFTLHPTSTITVFIKRDAIDKLIKEKGLYVEDVANLIMAVVKGGKHAR